MSVQAERPADAIAALWNRRLPLVRERLDVLECAASALGRGGLDDEHRAEARRLAHMLSGSLGMFGFPRASELAREVELTLDDAPSEADASRLAAFVSDLRAELLG